MAKRTANRSTAATAPRSQPEQEQGTAKAPTGVLVRLSKPHTHAGKMYPAMDVIETDAQTARWITQQGIGQPVADSQPAKEQQP